MQLRQINDRVDQTFREVPDYRGSLDQYPWYHNFTDDLLNFLQSLPNKHRIWFCDDMQWNDIDPPDTYDTYIIGAWIETIHIAQLRYINNKLGHKNLILLSPQDFTDVELNNFKIFRIEHLHKLKRFYPKKPYTKLQDRTHSQSFLSKHPHVHKTIFLAEFIQNNKDQNILYSFGPTQDNTINADNFFDKQKLFVNIPLSEDTKSTIKDLWHRFPIIIDHGKEWSIDNLAYSDTVMNWVAETWFSYSTNSSPFITEKTIKPIVSGSVFAVLGQKNTYKRIKRLGFKNYFDNYESEFDTMWDNERAVAMIDFIKVLAGKDLAYLQHQVDENYNYFYGDFYDYIEEMNQPNKKEVIEYIKNL